MFYFRVFRTIRPFRVGLWLTGFLVIAWCAAINLLAILECLPVQSYWTHGPRRCINNESAFLGTTITNVIIDVIILVLPLPVLWKLHVKRSRKLALTGVFICGYW